MQILDCSVAGFHFVGGEDKTSNASRGVDAGIGAPLSRILIFIARRKHHSLCYAVLGQILKNWYLNRIPNTC